MLLSGYGLIKAISNDVKFWKCDGGGYKRTGHVDKPGVLCVVWSMEKQLDSLPGNSTVPEIAHILYKSSAV